MDKIMATVKCDYAGCGWSETIPRDDVPKWHKRNCPKCGNDYIINDAELIGFRIVLALEAVSKEVDPEGKSCREVHIDSAHFRTLNKEVDYDE